MADIPMLPIQQGGNLSALSFVEGRDNEPDRDKEVEQIAEALDLDTEDVEQEVIELEDGSVVVNFTETQKPSENPEFYANLAEELEEGDSEVYNSSEEGEVEEEELEVGAGGAVLPRAAPMDEPVPTPASIAGRQRRPFL